METGKKYFCTKLCYFLNTLLCIINFCLIFTFKKLFISIHIDTTLFINSWSVSFFSLQDDFDSLRPLCYPNTDVFLVCFSVVSPTSYHNVTDKWLPELRRHCPDAPIILVGTQSDLRSDVKVLIELARYREQPVNEEQARKLANRIGAEMYIESSALTQKNLKEVFDQAILCALSRNSELQKVTTGGRWRSRNKDKKSGYSEKKQSFWKKLCCFS